MSSSNSNGMLQPLDKYRPPAVVASRRAAHAIVVVNQGDDIVGSLRRLKKLVINGGVLMEIKRGEHHLSRGQRLRRKSRMARKRAIELPGTKRGH